MLVFFVEILLVDERARQTCGPVQKMEVSGSSAEIFKDLARTRSEIAPRFDDQFAEHGAAVFVAGVLRGGTTNSGAFFAVVPLLEVHVDREGDVERAGTGFAGRGGETDLRLAGGEKVLA